MFGRIVQYQLIYLLLKSMSTDVGHTLARTVQSISHMLLCFASFICVIDAAYEDSHPLHPKEQTYAI